MKFKCVATIVLAFGLVFIAGCVPIDPNAGQTLDGSFMSPGIYFGTTICDMESDGAIFSETTDDIQLIIGESGIPMRLGEEEYVGRTDEVDLFGVTFVMTVVEVSAFSNGVKIKTHGVFNENGIDILIQLEEALYKPLSNGRIEATSNLSALGEDINFDAICRTIYSQ